MSQQPNFQNSIYQYRPDLDRVVKVDYEGALQAIDRDREIRQELDVHYGMTSEREFRQAEDRARRPKRMIEETNPSVDSWVLQMFKDNMAAAEKRLQHELVVAYAQQHPYGAQFLRYMDFLRRGTPATFNEQTGQVDVAFRPGFIQIGEAVAQHDRIILQLQESRPNWDKMIDPAIKKELDEILEETNKPIAVEPVPARNDSGFNVTLDITFTPLVDCPDCKGSGEYVGFAVVETCARCQGKKRIPQAATESD